MGFTLTIDFEEIPRASQSPLSRYVSSFSDVSLAEAADPLRRISSSRITVNGCASSIRPDRRNAPPPPSVGHAACPIGSIASASAPSPTSLCYRSNARKPLGHVRQFAHLVDGDISHALGCSEFEGGIQEGFSNVSTQTKTLDVHWIQKHNQAPVWDADDTNRRLPTREEIERR